MAKNSGTLTCLWLLSIMPTTECGRLSSSARSRCDKFLCSRALVSTVATALDVALRKAFKFCALRLTERAIIKAYSPCLDFLSGTHLDDVCCLFRKEAMC
jgi:hypothetical protein